MKLLYAPEPELEPIVNNAARRIFGPKKKIQEEVDEAMPDLVVASNKVLAKQWGVAWNVKMDEEFARKLQEQGDSDIEFARKLQQQGDSADSAIDVDMMDVGLGISTEGKEHSESFHGKDLEKSRKTKDIMDWLKPKTPSEWEKPVKLSDAFKKADW